MPTFRASAAALIMKSFRETLLPAAIISFLMAMTLSIAVVVVMYE